MNNACYFTPVPSRRISTNGKVEFRLAAQNAVVSDVSVKFSDGTSKFIGTFPLKKNLELTKIYPDIDGLLGEFDWVLEFKDENGEVIDPNHELKGQIIKDKVLFIPGGKGSTVGSYVIFQMMKNNTAPKAIICLNAEPIIATGAIMSDIAMVDSPAETKDLTNGTLVEVDGDNGTIEIL